jgi:hypothetical protein
MKLTRDGVVIWLLAAAALAAYLKSVGVPPTAWDYNQWLEFAAACAMWGTGKLGASLLPSTKEVARGYRDDGRSV